MTARDVPPDLRTQVLESNLAIADAGLAALTWGNASGIDRDRGLVVIKPSGVPYERLTTAELVVVDLAGCVVKGDLHPSTDTPTHVRLYTAFPEIGGVAHSHSPYAIAFAQAQREIPCLGTTHADAFHGTIPVTRDLTPDEIAQGYELHTGDVIVERFAGLDPAAVPGVLVARHGPFTWGATAIDAVHALITLEAVAETALLTYRLDPAVSAAPQDLADRHHRRKHGPNAYYGNPPVIDDAVMENRVIQSRVTEKREDCA
jgi:L-ribulose-5-phosphate 4-epimerase